MKYKVKIGKAEDRETLALILVKNDYVVRITKQERDSKRSYADPIQRYASHP